MTQATPDHPHDYDGEVPDRLPPATVRELSRLDPAHAAVAIVVEWSAIVAAIALCEALGGGWLYPLTVIFIGARQHALVVLGHDAVHYRLLPIRWLNDAVANLLLWWPCAATNEVFRQSHGAHHRYLGTERDGNIALWRLRGPDGRPTREWTYPKTPAQLVAKILWSASSAPSAASASSTASSASPSSAPSPPPSRPPAASISSPTTGWSRSPPGSSPPTTSA